MGAVTTNPLPEFLIPGKEDSDSKLYAESSAAVSRIIHYTDGTYLPCGQVSIQVNIKQADHGAYNILKNSQAQRLNHPLPNLLVITSSPWSGHS
jgi:hypothetical protein